MKRCIYCGGRLLSHWPLQWPLKYGGLCIRCWVLREQFAGRIQ